jgi:hypothetical protein
MKATDVLRAQHGELRALFKALASGGDDAMATRDRLAALLRLHTRLEETFFYPAVREHERRAGELVTEAYEEHDIADIALMRLLAAEPRSEQGQARGRVLQKIVENHLHEEEHDLFKRAERLPDQRLHEIGDQLRTEIDEVARVDVLLGRAAFAAQRTEQWAGQWLDMGVRLPRRAARALAPTRLLGLDDPSPVWATAIARAVPKWVVDGLYDRVVGNEANGQGGNGHTHHPRSARGGRGHHAHHAR